MPNRDGPKYTALQINFRLILGVFIISWSSILIRWMGSVNPLIITFYRLSISALILLPLAFRRKETVYAPSPKTIFLLLLAGLFLAIHFYGWITSLQLTSVGNSIFLESTHPIFGFLLSLFLLKEKSSRSLLPALLLSLAGIYLLAFKDIHQNYVALSGDAYAVFSAFCFAAYLTIARMLRRSMPLLKYVFFVYLSAAVFIFILLLWQNINFWQLSRRVWILLLLLALGPNLSGHSLMNWAARHIRVYLVNMALLSESVLATLYAAVLLNEIPQGRFYLGALFILVSIWLVFKNGEAFNTAEV